MLNDNNKNVVNYRIILLLLIFFLNSYTITINAASYGMRSANLQDKNKIQKCLLEKISMSKDVTHIGKTFTIKVIGLLNKNYKSPTINNITATAERETVSEQQNDISKKNIKVTIHSISTSIIGKSTISKPKPIIKNRNIIGHCRTISVSIFITYIIEKNTIPAKKTMAQKETFGTIVLLSGKVYKYLQKTTK